MVREYQRERERQGLVWEQVTGAYPGDEEHVMATVGTFVITFKQWLKAHKGRGQG